MLTCLATLSETGKIGAFQNFVDRDNTLFSIVRFRDGEFQEPNVQSEDLAGGSVRLQTGPTFPK